MNTPTKILVGAGIAYLLFRPTTANAAASGSVLTESFLGYPASTTNRGIRNNNLGNLKMGSSAWQGMVPQNQNTDGTFEQFTTMAYGTRAMIKLLYNYITRKGNDTIHKIIADWDLGSTHYIQFLVNNTSFTEHQVLQPTKQTLKELAQAIARMEVGEWFLTDARFDAGYSLL